MVYKSMGARLSRAITALATSAISSRSTPAQFAARTRVARLCERTLGRAFPPFCLLCLSHSAIDNTYICQPCQADLPSIDQACPRCGLPLAAASAALVSPGNKLAASLATPMAAHVCGRCQQQPPAFDYCIGAFHYAAPIRGLIGRYKYRGELATGRSLALLLAQHIDRWYGLQEQPASIHAPVLLPVPLHPQRLRERGFNQSVLLAQTISATLAGQHLKPTATVIAKPKLPVATDLVIRLRHTENQKDLNRDERYANMRDAFSLDGSKALPAHIIIVDDVVTSAATVNALATLLKKQGAEKVGVWCIARTLL